MTTIETDRVPLISAARFEELLAGSTPLMAFLGLRTESVAHGRAVIRMPFSPALVRPGGSHAGPSLMAVADIAMYAAVLSVVGDDPRPLTTTMSLEFLKRPPNRDLLADCRVVGGIAPLVVGRIEIRPADEPDEIVCASMCTYALPRDLAGT